MKFNRNIHIRNKIHSITKILLADQYSKITESTKHPINELFQRLQCFKNKHNNYQAYTF